MRLARAVAGVVLAVAAVAPAAHAQGYFGQNQVQYDKFHWRVLETEHFLIYYYPEERPATMDGALEEHREGVVDAPKSRRRRSSLRAAMTQSRYTWA